MTYQPPQVEDRMYADPAWFTIVTVTEHAVTLVSDNGSTLVIPMAVWKANTSVIPEDPKAKG